MVRHCFQRIYTLYLRDVSTQKGVFIAATESCRSFVSQSTRQKPFRNNMLIFINHREGFRKTVRTIY
jgi:hypothetical protein